MKVRLATAFSCVLFIPFGVLCLVWTFRSVARADFLTALVALGFAVFTLGFVAMLVIVAARKVTPRIACDDAGITFRPDSRVDRLLTAATIGAFLAMALYAIFAPLDMVNIPVPRGDRRYFVVACAAGALGGIPSMWQIVKQRGMSHLRMTLDGLEVGGAVSTKKRAWDEVTDIADRPRNGRRPSGTTYLTTADGQTRTLVSDWYTPGGHALRELVRLYWQHPEHRVELQDGRAAIRLDTAP